MAQHPKKKAKKKKKIPTSRKTAKRKTAKRKTAKRKTAKKVRKAANSARTSVGRAGRPVRPRAGARALALAARPSDEDLDIRDRLKSAPRRQAGPPLSGDTPDRASMNALRKEVIPEPTEPKGR